MGQIWFFDRIPESERERVKQLVDDEDNVELLKIHNKYKVSIFTYESCCNLDPMRDWFKYGIENGFI